MMRLGLCAGFKFVRRLHGLGWTKRKMEERKDNRREEYKRQMPRLGISCPVSAGT